MIKENYHNIEYNGIKPKKVYDKYDSGKAKLDSEGNKILLREEQWIYKDFFYDSYLKSTNSKYKLTKINFWTDLQKECSGKLRFARVKAEDGRREAVLLPEIKEVKLIFENLQKFTWDEEPEDLEDYEEISDDESDDDLD